MTENESVLITLQNAIECATDDITREDLEMMVKCLEELQAYREIGTVDDYWKLNEICKEYSAIGTIEEFKVLKEKNEPKKVKGISLTHEGRVGNCPACGRLVRHQEQTAYCSCEQKLYWSEE